MLLTRTVPYSTHEFICIRLKLAGPAKRPGEEDGYFHRFTRTSLPLYIKKMTVILVHMMRINEGEGMSQG